MSAPLAHISAISLFVEDLPAAKSFYRDVFDAAIVFEDNVSVALRFEGVIVNLLHITSAEILVDPHQVAAAATGVRCQFSIWVSDVDARCDDLRARGVTLLTGPRDQPWGMRTATFVDPAGHSWEVAQRIGPVSA
jgi:uncharacterized glyoxalase superfamily protein PhnB